MGEWVSYLLLGIPWVGFSDGWSGGLFDRRKVTVIPRRVWGLGMGVGNWQQ